MPACTNCHRHDNGFMPGLANLPDGQFVSADTCAECHAEYHTDWTDTIHAAAWDRLPPFAQTNPGCLPCHTVGFGEADGYVDQATNPELAGVQCENCHGAGHDHAANPLVVPVVIDKSAELCRRLPHRFAPPDV